MAQPSPRIDPSSPAADVRSPLALLRADLEAYAGSVKNPPRGSVDLAIRVLTLPRLQSIALFRLAQAVRRRSARLAAVVKSVNSALTGCDIASEAQVGGGLQLLHPFGVVIGPDVVIGERCRILAGVVFGAGLGGASPVVGDDVVLGTHAVVIGAITVGDRAEVGAQCLVTVDVPAGGRARAPKATIHEPR